MEGWVIPMDPSTALPFSSTRGPSRRGDRWLGDRGASEVIGSLLMASITVAMAVTFGHSMVNEIPSEPGPAPSSVEMGLDGGPGGWQDGDEHVHVTHTSGAALARNGTTIRITVGDTVHTYAGADLGGPFADGQLTIGERWQANLSIPASTDVDVQVVRETPSRRVIASSLMESGSLDCSTDSQAPYAASWSQSPSDLDATHSGPLDLTVTAEDACAGVDTATTPHLEYRFSGTTTFSDDGAMTQLSGATWRGSIPEPSDGWDAHGGETLVYRVNPLADHANNTEPSQTRSETIEADDALGGELTYVTDHLVFSGTVTDFPAAQNASDDGDTAVLEENVTSPDATTSEAYGTAYSSSGGVKDPGDATGSPDDVHASTDDHGEFVGVEGFQTFSGEIQRVEVALQGHHQGTLDGAADELELAYRVGTQPGKTKGLYGPSDLNETTDGPTQYLNVTSDRDWTWSDVDELQVRATYERNGPLDGLTYDIDALWIRLTYDNPAYNMSIRADVEGLPTGSHDLELRYAISDETHHVQVWNFTAGTWATRGSALTATTLTDWSVPLASDEADGGQVRLRIVDDVRDASQQSTVELDHARVRTR